MGAKEASLRSSLSLSIMSAQLLREPLVQLLRDESEPVMAVLSRLQLLENACEDTTDEAELE